MEAIVILPRDMLYSTDISVTLQISAGNQQNGKTVKQRNRKNIAELFGHDSKTIHKHIANAIKEEFADEMVVANFATITEYGAIKGKSQTNHARFAVLQALKRRPRKYLFQLYQLTFEAASPRVVISILETTTPFRSPPRKDCFHYEINIIIEKREKGREKKGKDTEKTGKEGARKNKGRPYCRPDLRHRHIG